MRARIAFLAVSASCAVLAARIQTAQTQTPEFRTGINFVRVDVTVSGKNGAFVSDLAPSDFEITEQGKPQKIETFKLVTLDGGLFPGPEGPPHAITSDADETREAARDDVRLFGIFLDDYHVSREAGLGARETIAHFISNDLGPSDMVGLMNPITPMSSVLFTRNHDAVAKAIDQFLGRQGDYEPKNTAEENVYLQNLDRPAVIEQIRNEVAFSALEGFINHLGSAREEACPERRTVDARPAGHVAVGVRAERLEIPLASLASGEYVIDVAAEGNAGQVHELVGIRVM